MISVGIATGYGLDGRVQFLAGAKFSLLHRVQACFGAHPVSYSMGTGGDFTGIKPAGREADHSLSSVEDKNGGAIPPLPCTPSWHSA
jgi:hypothetical protein